MNCSAEACERDAWRANLCQAHYQRRWRTGDVQAHIPLRPFGDVRAQVFGRVDRESLPGCWLWTGSLDKEGYGYVNAKSLGSSPIAAYRAAYLLVRGPIPPGLALDHLCHTNDAGCPGGKSCQHRRCVNPDHLEPVTTAENNHRSRAYKGGPALSKQRWRDKQRKAS